MRIAITGGIGSGKSYVCELLAQKGITVYDCDAAAKRLMMTSAEIQNCLSTLVGANVFTGGEIQKPLLTAFILASEDNKQAVNDIVHPAVAQDFMTSDYEWFESAIYFDSRFDTRLTADHVVCVCAPLELRIHRIMLRDGISNQKAQEWIQRQLPQEEIAKRSEFLIQNDGILPLEPQINTILNQIYNQSN